MWYDDDGEPVTRNGKQLPRPCPPACHRCQKHKLGVEVLTPGNERLHGLHTDATMGLVTAGSLRLGERLALRVMQRTTDRAARMRLALDLGEVMHGRP